MGGTDPDKVVPANHPTDELDQLKEVLAEAEELCLKLALEKHLEAQRAEREL